MACEARSRIFWMAPREREKPSTDAQKFWMVLRLSPWLPANSAMTAESRGP